MSRYFRYTDLQRMTRWMGWLLVVPLLLTVRGFVHGLANYQWLADVPAGLPLSGLPEDLRYSLQVDSLLRVSQISATLLFLTFFCFVWLFLAFRNLIALTEERENTVRNSVGILAEISRGLLTATSMLRRLFQGSAPESHAHLTLRYTIPACTLALIAANVCKIVAVIKLHGAASVGAWRSGESWMLAAYVCYALLYLLAWRVATRLEMLQRAAWQQRGGH
ncbi:MAG TPA: hypothetical protein VFW42_05635 [Fluviicoccus sp.]|nr:hypothetical protein [Fluviicoccus sp.]